jgi:hypothetical protein
MKREYSGSIGYFLMTVPHLNTINEKAIENLAKRLKVQPIVLKLMIDLLNSRLN